MMPKPVQQTIAIHILPNISRKEDNQTITFGQLIEDNRKFLLKNHSENVMEKLLPEPFLKKQT